MRHRSGMSTMQKPEAEQRALENVTLTRAQPMVRPAEDREWGHVAPTSIAMVTDATPELSRIGTRPAFMVDMRARRDTRSRSRGSMIQRTRPDRRPLRPAVSDEGHAAPDQGRQHPAAPSGPGLAWLILMVAVGSILAITGIGLIMSTALASGVSRTRPHCPYSTSSNRRASRIDVHSSTNRRAAPSRPRRR